MRGGAEENVGHDEDAGQQEDAQQRAAADDDEGEDGERDSSRESTPFLHLLHFGGDLLLHGGAQMDDFGQSASDLRGLLDGAESGCVGAGEQQRGDDGGAAITWLKHFGEAGALEGSGLAFMFPDGRFGKERAEDGERNGGNDGGDQRIAPGGVAVINRGERGADVAGEIAGFGDGGSAERREGLSPAEDALASLGFRE